jgi:hypothetical protein
MPGIGGNRWQALLYAALGSAAWNAQSALLQSRLSFAGAPAAESPAGAGSAGISDIARLGIRTYVLCSTYVLWLWLGVLRTPVYLAPSGISQ